MWREELWAWLREAPPPVVLALSLTGFLSLGGWVWGVSADAINADRNAAIAVEQAKNAKDNVDRLADLLARANAKLDRLLEDVAAIRQEQQDRRGVKP